MKLGKKNLEESNLSFVSYSLIFYGFLLLTGIYICSFNPTNLIKIFSFSELSWPLSHVVLISFVSFILMLLLSHLFKLLFPSYEQHKKYVYVVLGKLKMSQILIISVVSAASEEIFFRAALQPNLGVFLTSIIIGLLQLGPQARLTAFSAYSFIRNCIFGMLFYYTNVIFIPFFVHALLNIIYLSNLSDIRSRKPKDI